jgi:hypothetical protein
LLFSEILSDILLTKFFVFEPEVDSIALSGEEDFTESEFYKSSFNYLGRGGFSTGKYLVSYLELF